MDPHYQDFGTENELAEILSHYNSNFVCDIVKDQINRSISSGIATISSPPNVVYAWEQNFKAILDQYGVEESARIQEVRQNTYQEIIDIICDSFNMNFTIADVDIFSAASTLYDLFVCNLPNNIISFFSKYIYKERSSIYDGMGLSEMKKNKDSSTIYGKRMYKDIKLAVINANIVKIINNICNGMEFDFQTIINTVIEDKNMSKYILSIIADRGNLFDQTIIPMINNNLPEYITGIRLAIQELAISHDQIIYNTNNITEIENV